MADRTRFRIPGSTRRIELQSIGGAGSFPVMIFSNMEDRLNPATPADADEATLGGYLAIHGRSAAFEGGDGQPYTVGIETEPREDENGWVAFLVFLRWAATGTAIMGHIESGDLVHAPSEEEAHAALEMLPLIQVREILDEAIRRKRAEETG